MWIDKKEQNEWAYNECLRLKKEKKKDVDEIWRLITDSEWAYEYCIDVKDREQMWKRITDSYWAYRYCRDMKDRPEVRKYIKEK